MTDIKKELSQYGKLLVEKGLTTGPGGNISARQGDTIYLSPSGFSLDEIEPEDWFAMDLKTGKQVGKSKQGLRPTCEVSMHLGCYLVRKDIGAVIHTHPVLATALATANVKFKGMFPDFIALIGPEVPAVDYVIPAGEEIRKAVTSVIKKGYDVVLLKNHGAVALGANLKYAYFRSLYLEDAARFLWAILSTGKKVRYMTPKEVEGIENLEAEDYRKLLLKKRG
ncbi:MAG: aldolase [bacterium (Candidatus Ratteibacteria) CG23_combo_of_CG06-09_8_20_14_all_48_7]|uniref:Aldolase n=1 Tax=bacterium (Candidatus Ratteibacteria) CG23_combo_of_CG06-09_8_20_14_all_48_7 TaxID=2014292 RepID=A0A2G9YAS1_9BACT|nr:MAG: aldolase [bacterium (Candidatus Ratteibacteria) CG23_combo_of_CG06-09_8_20_14_all_48_7]